MASMSVDSFAKEVEKDPDLAAKVKEDPAGALRAAGREAAYVTDKGFYRLAIVGLILIVLIVVVGGLVIELWTVGSGEEKKTLPDGVLALGTTALGVLGGLFITSPTEK